jgi:hypothetical protein
MCKKRNILVCAITTLFQHASRLCYSEVYKMIIVAFPDQKQTNTPNNERACRTYECCDDMLQSPAHVNDMLQSPARAVASCSHLHVPRADKSLPPARAQSLPSLNVALRSTVSHALCSSRIFILKSRLTRDPECKRLGVLGHQPRHCQGEILVGRVLLQHTVRMRDALAPFLQHNSSDTII